MFQLVNDHESVEKLQEIEEAERLLDEVYKLIQGNNHKDALLVLNRLIDIIRFDENVRQLRADCFFKLGEIQMVIFCEINYLIFLGYSRTEVQCSFGC